MAAAHSLLAWLRASGGLVDAALGVGVSSAGRRGLRGLIATRRIEASSRPLVAVPEPLILTPSAASTALSHFHGASPDLGAALAALDPAAPLAVLLALEAQSQPRRPSPWGLYALALDATHPAGWGVPGPQTDAALAAAGVPVAERPAWARPSATSRAAAEALAQKAAALVEKDGQRRRGGGQAATTTTTTTASLPPLAAQAVAWGLGHVVSRAFRMPATPSHAGGQPALLPVIDLANHAAGSADPAWAEAPGAPHRFATLRAGAGPERAPVALEAGQELTTSYAAGNGSSGLEWWLNYGFVPEEVRE